MSAPNPFDQPGGRRPAPYPLDLVQAFLNTCDLEGGVEELTGPEALGAWLVRHHLIDERAPVGPADLDRALAVRGGWRELTLANAGLRPDPAAVEVLNRALASAPLLPGFDTTARWRLAPAAEGVDAALAHMAALVVEAMTAGTWARLKPCRRHACRWIFYDHSTNRSGTWCTMSICGNRQKARTYRRRHHPRPTR